MSISDRVMDASSSPAKNLRQTGTRSRRTDRTAGDLKRKSCRQGLEQQQPLLRLQQRLPGVSGSQTRTEKLMLREWVVIVVRVMMLFLFLLQIHLSLMMFAVMRGSWERRTMWPQERRLWEQE